jgi:uncharacterized RmlC-like cupin family protein
MSKLRFSLGRECATQTKHSLAIIGLGPAIAFDCVSRKDFFKMTSVVSSPANSKGKAIKNDGKPTGDHSDGVVVVRPAVEIMSRQQLPYYVGISEVTKNISMNLIIIPPAAAAEPHPHKRYETVIYLLKGRVDTRYGQQLENSVICEEGDFIYIKADVPHQPINLSASEPCWFSRAMMPTSKNMWLLTGERRSPHLMPRSVVVKRTKTVWVDEQQRERVAH